MSAQTAIAIRRTRHRNPAAPHPALPILRCLFLLGVVALLYLWQVSGATSSATELQTLQAKQSVLQRQDATLHQQLGQARRPAYFDQRARAMEVGLPAEASGLMAQPSSPGDTALALAENSFGESIAVTPLQMAAAYGALANGGVPIRPCIVARVTHDGGTGSVTSYGPHVVRRAVSVQSAKTATQMLVDSALKSESEMNLVDGYSVAAKTGTSTPDPNNPSWTYASVVGYAPASNPRFVLLVKLDHPRATIFGGEAAGPLWRELAKRMFAYYHIPPDKAA